jgi:hypothetical protein
MPLRRRPLARAAIVGGVAYSAGKRREAGQQQDAETDARLADLEAQQAAAAPPPAAAAPAPAAGGMSDQTIQQLKDLAALHEQGVLTDEEFTAQKQKILGG